MVGQIACTLFVIIAALSLDICEFVKMYLIKYSVKCSPSNISYCVIKTGVVLYNAERQLTYQGVVYLN